MTKVIHGIVICAVHSLAVTDPDEPNVVLDDETARLEPSSTSGLCLLVVGPGGGVAHPLPSLGTLLLGRSSECDVTIEDATISRKHAELAVSPTTRIRDLDSANGVRVGQKLLPPNVWTEVELGQAVELGSVVVVIHRPTMLPRVAAPAEARERRPSLEPGGPAVVRDAAMKRLYAMVERIAPSELSVLLLGETGVGKEVIADALHETSRRADGPMLRLNCSALSEALVESELFGHVRGAFTGALRDKPGLLEAARGGTVFLDEVGELPTAVQAKLLRVLEAREVTRVGSLEPRSIDVRFVAATNRDLKTESEAGRFRTDLYFRLNGISLTIPPLRARPSEIEPLARRFAAGAGGADAPAPEISDGAIAALEAYAWPGNVRELKNAVERAAVLAGGAAIRPEHLPPEITTPPGQAVDDDDASGASLSDQMGALEKRRILEALDECDGNQTKAAELLGMPRRTFVKRLDAYGIVRPRKK